MTEVRLIDSNALKELEPHYSEDGYRVFYEYEIDNAPTVETTCPYLSDDEVKQPCLQAPCKRPKGYWTYVNHGYYKCSKCENLSYEIKPFYCSNCGSRMGVN